jgi:hypothetical protein
MFIILIISITRKDFIDVLEILTNKINKKIILEMIANLVKIFLFFKFQFRIQLMNDS